MTAPADTSVVSTAHGSDLAVAVRNTVKLGASLVATWTIALVVRFQLPRHLGPERFADFNFCDAFTGAFFAFVGLGIDTYIQKEISVRPQHISDFFGGVIVTRAVLSMILTIALAVVLGSTGRGAQIHLALVFAAFQFATTVNASLASAMQASTKIGALASVNVASKLVWGGGLAIAIALDMPLLVLAVPNLLSELLRTYVLWQAARKQVGLRWTVRYADTKPVLAASLPFYVNGIAVGLASRLDVSLLGFQATDLEVGWYGAAGNLAGLAFLLSPLVPWILMPLLSRAKHRSEAEFFFMLRRAFEGLLVMAIPITLMIALGADFWIALAFGESFGPAAISLRYLAPTFIVTYLAIMLAIALVLTDRSWRLTTISLVGVLMQPLMSFIFVPLMSRLGTGHAGSGAAIALIGQELVVSSLMLASMGIRAIDNRLILTIVKSIGISGLVIVIHILLAGLGSSRLAVDFVVYAALSVATRTVRLGEMRNFIRLVRSQRAETSAP